MLHATLHGAHDTGLAGLDAAERVDSEADPAHDIVSRGEDDLVGLVGQLDQDRADDEDNRHSEATCPCIPQEEPNASAWESADR